MTEKRYTITAALPYANGPVHIGHIAGCYLPADIYVRHLKAQGKDVLFICGSDEHGVPITIRAKKEGLSPQQVVDKYHHLMRKAFDDFGIEFTYYGRTSAPIHHQTSADFFKQIYTHGGFTEETTEQYYDPIANQFLADRYITGTCPKCGNPSAYGDQCEKCGSTLSPTDLIEPKSAISGEKPIMKATKNWFLPLDVLQQKYINEYIKSHETDWKTNVYGQCNSWLADGLRPRAMTRDLDWGVPVPVEGAEGKVLYVWFDAPIGYISATKEYFETQAAQGIGNKNDWEKYWVKDEQVNQQLIHFIGKDNIVFHCIIFPATLMALNETSDKKYIYADQVPANEFLNLEGEKISTSRNWAVWLHEYLEDFADRTDELRYYLTAIAPETKDSDFTWKGYQLAVNSELVAILGNFVNRGVVLCHKFFEGKVPANNGWGEKEELLFAELEKTTAHIYELIEKFNFREAQNQLIQLFRNGNKYFAETEPWHLIKTDVNQTATVINTALQYTASLGILCQAFLPKTYKQIASLLHIDSSEMVLSKVGNRHILEVGSEIAQAIHLFKNIEDAEIEKQIQKLEQSKINNQLEKLAEATVAEAKPEIQFEDFSKIDIRVATILDAVKVPKTDKLLQLSIDTGIDKRTVVSGIAAYHKPEDIIGKQILVLVNLAPRKMKGIDSQGMILMAQDTDGKLIFVAPENKVDNGSGVS
jgi:methionyl-tRNA synthetase